MTVTASSSRTARTASAAAATVLAVGWLAALVTTGVTARDAGAWVLALAWTVLLPGWCLVRLLRPQPTFTAEACWGFCAGLVVQLAAWAVSVGTGHPWLLRAYPLLLLPALVPRLRERLSPRPSPRAAGGPAVPAPQPGSVWAPVALVAAAAVVLVRCVLPFFGRTPLPAISDGRWYGDLYWHLAITAEATRAVPPQVPQVAGEPMRYHWFSNAHVAATSLVAGTDTAVAQARLWVGPAVLATLLGTQLLAGRLAGRPAAGVVALAVLAGPAALQVTGWVGWVGADPFGMVSPSHLFGLPLSLLAAGLLVDAVRDELDGRGWALLALALAGCAGAKASLLPTLVAGLALAVVTALVRRRGRVPALTALALVAVVLVGAAPLVAGGRQESHLGPGLLDRLPVAPALHATGQDGRTLSVAGVLVVLVVLLQKAPVLLSLAARPPAPGDPGRVLLLGAAAGGCAGTLLIDHPSLSQVYFATGVLPLVAVLTGWGTAALLAERPPGPAAVRLVLVAAAAAGVSTALAAVLTPGGRPVLLTAADLTPLGVLVGLWLLGALLVAVLIHRGRPRADAPRSWTRPCVGAVVLGVLLAPPLRVPLDALHPAAAAPARRSTLPPGAVAATAWLARHTPADDVVATNAHCLGGPTRPGCDAREFWPAGLSGRRMYVEAWGYTDQARAAHGRGGLPYTHQPFHDPARLARNDAAFTDPTPAGLAALRRAGVRWLLADAGAGPVSPRLAALATPRLRSGRMTVYQLRG